MLNAWGQREGMAFARSTNNLPIEQETKHGQLAQIQEGRSLRKLSFDWVCFLSGIGSMVTS